jgi:hypothetical protein
MLRTMSDIVVGDIILDPAVLNGEGESVRIVIEYLQVNDDEGEIYVEGFYEESGDEYVDLFDLDEQIYIQKA